MDSLTRIFCATLGSSHRYIVNSAVSLWNRLYGKVEKLDYSEELKQVLAKLRPYADLVTPGLELSSLEYPSHEPIFVESMEEFSLPRLPPPSSRRTTRSASRTNSPVKTPDPVKRRSPTKRRASATPEVKSSGFNLRPKAAAPRLRHDDSQIQFAAVESSPQLNLINEEMESQLLTERQKEVRERQKENAALFPELRSSPATRTRSSARLAARSREGSPSGAQTPQAGTPSNAGGRFTDHVSGTPTPRRGQAALAIIDQDMDMTDPPSSPPVEPRRNPLAAEIRSRSANTSLLDDWQLSSSPISGSPLRQQSFAPVPSSLAVAAALDAVNAAAAEEGRREDLMEEDDDIIEESVLPEQENQVLPTMEPTKKKEIAGSGKGSGLQGHLSVPRQQTPEESDHELEKFVDAPSSPLPPTPHRAGRSAKPTTQANTDPVKKAAPAPAPPPASTPAFATAPTIAPTATAAAPAPTPSGAPSYDGGEWDDRSLLKLVVELDSGKLNRQEYTRPSPSVSPEKLPVPLTAAHLRPNSSNKAGGGSGPTSSAVPSPSPAASCIVALDGDDHAAEEPEREPEVAPKPTVTSRGRVTRSRASPVASNRSGSVSVSAEQIPSSQPGQPQAQEREKGGKSKLKGPTSARAGAGAEKGAAGTGKGKRKRVASLGGEETAAAGASTTAAATETATATAKKKRRVGRPSSSTAAASASAGTTAVVEKEAQKPEPIFYERLPMSAVSVPSSSRSSSSLSQPPSSRGSRASSVVSNSVLTERPRGQPQAAAAAAAHQRTTIIPSSMPQQISQLSAPAAAPAAAPAPAPALAPVLTPMEVELEVEVEKTLPLTLTSDAADEVAESQDAPAQSRQEIEELSSDGEELVQSQIEFESRSADERQQSLSLSQLEEQSDEDEDEDLIPSSVPGSLVMGVRAGGSGSGTSDGSGNSEEVLVEDTILSQQQPREGEQEDEPERMELDVDDDDDEQPLASTPKRQKQQTKKKKQEVGVNKGTLGDAKLKQRVEEGRRLTEDLITSETGTGNSRQDSRLGKSSLQQKTQQRPLQAPQLQQQQDPQNRPGEDMAPASSLVTPNPNNHNNPNNNNQPQNQINQSTSSDQISQHQQQQHPPGSPPSGSKERILTSLRASLAELRTATTTGGLSRQEVYEIEDLFMDLKRELYEAERRGRT